MGKQSKFDKLVESRSYFYLRRIFQIISLTFIFSLVSVLSLGVLFFPGLVSLHYIAYQMVNNEEYQVFKTFFVQIKKQWSFNWRLEVLGMSLIVIFLGCGYLYYTYYVNYGNDWFVWFGIIFECCLIIFSVCILLHLLVFNNYFLDDTFFMMIRKSALVARRKIKLTILMLLIFVSFVVVFYLLPYLIPFLSFGPLILINEYLYHKTYEKLSREEKESESVENN